MGRKSKEIDNTQDKEYVVATRVDKDTKIFIMNMAKEHDLHQSQCLRLMIKFYIKNRSKNDL